MSTIRVSDSGPQHARFDPVVLREGQTTRLVFRPTVVRNQQDHWQPVRGELVWQRRSKHQDEWDDDSSLKLSTMTAGSGIKLELSTSELHSLTMAVRGLYGYFWTQGLPTSGQEIDLEHYALQARTLSETGSVIDKIIQEHGTEGLASILEWAAKVENAENVVQHLSRLDVSSLGQISSVAGMSALTKALDVWNDNKDNGDEEFWQQTFEKHAFVLSQAFSVPVVVLQGKAYVGGKSIDNVGGNVVDFLLQNVISGHSLIVEIKTPVTPLLMATPYRPPNVYAVNKEISGGIVQAATAKDSFQKEFATLTRDSGKDIRAADPPCLLIAGNLAQLDTAEKQQSFELFRRGQRLVEIITFDELYRKIEVLLNLLEGERA